MQYRTFGDSDLTVSTLGFGGWPMGGTQYGTTGSRQMFTGSSDAFAEEIGPLTV